MAGPGGGLPYAAHQHSTAQHTNRNAQHACATSRHWCRPASGGGRGRAAEPRRTGCQKLEQQDHLYARHHRVGVFCPAQQALCHLTAQHTQHSGIHIGIKAVVPLLDHNAHTVHVRGARCMDMCMHDCAACAAELGQCNGITVPHWLELAYTPEQAGQAAPRRTLAGWPPAKAPLPRGEGGGRRGLLHVNDVWCMAPSTPPPGGAVIGALGAAEPDPSSPPRASPGSLPGCVGVTSPSSLQSVWGAGRGPIYWAASSCPWNALAPLDVGKGGRVRVVAAATQHCTYACVACLAPPTLDYWPAVQCTRRETRSK